MPATPRKILARRISNNRGRGCQLSDPQRNCIIQAVLGGESIRIVASRFEVHRNTVSKLVQRYRRTGIITAKPRSGRPSKLNHREKRLLFRYVRKNPTFSYLAIQEWADQSIGKRISFRTIRRVIFKLGLRHWKSLQRIFLSKKAILERNRYWREWRGRELDLAQVRALRTF